QQLLLKVVPFVVDGGPAQGEDGFRVVHQLPVGRPLNECAVPRRLDEISHAVHGSIELPHFPVRSARSAVEHLGETVGVDVQLIRGRALWAQVPVIDGAFRVALDVDNVAVYCVNESSATHGAVGADTGRDLRVLDTDL